MEKSSEYGRNFSNENKSRNFEIKGYDGDLQQLQQ